MCMCLRPVQRGSEVKLLKPIAGVLSKQSMKPHVSHRRHHLRVTTVTPRPGLRRWMNKSSSSATIESVVRS